MTKISKIIKATQQKLDIAYLGVASNRLTYYNSKFLPIDVTKFKASSDEYIVISIITEYVNLYLNGDIAIKNGLFSKALYLSYFVNFSLSSGFPADKKIDPRETIYLINNYNNIKEMLEKYKTPYALYQDYYGNEDVPCTDFFTFICDWNISCSIIDTYYSGFESKYGVPKWVSTNEIATTYYTQNLTDDEWKELLKGIYHKEIEYLKTENNFISFDFDKVIGPIMLVNNIEEANVINLYGANIYIRDGKS